MKASEWAQAVETACRLLFPGKPLRQEVMRGTRVKARIELGPDIFVDLFFRQETGRIDYALIVRGLRRYGMDNLGGGGTSIPWIIRTCTCPSMRPHLKKHFIISAQQPAIFLRASTLAIFSWLCQFSLIQGGHKGGGELRCLRLTSTQHRLPHFPPMFSIRFRRRT